MTTAALNNLWNYIQRLSLTQSERSWLVEKLSASAKKEKSTAIEDRKARFLEMAGSWAKTSEGRLHYKEMKQRNSNQPANRPIPSFDE